MWIECIISQMYHYYNGFVLLCFIAVYTITEKIKTIKIHSVFFKNGMESFWRIYYRPFWCELSPCSESIKNGYYAHYRLYQVTPLGGKELPSPNRCNTNSSRPEMPTKQRYSTKYRWLAYPVQATLRMAAFCCSAALLASQACSNLCYRDWATVALSHQGV